MDRLKLSFSGGRPSSFQLSSPVEGQLEEQYLGPVENASEAKEIGLEATEDMADDPRKILPSVSAKDSSPVREYLSRLGKRSWSFDSAGTTTAGAAAAAAAAAASSGEGVSSGTSVPHSSSHSDAWSLFHELKGKITKTVEEQLGNKIDNWNEKLEHVKGMRMFQERLDKSKAPPSVTGSFSRGFDEADDTTSVSSTCSAPAGIARRSPSPAPYGQSPPRSPPAVIESQSPTVSRTASASSLVSSQPQTPPNTSTTSSTSTTPVQSSSSATARFNLPSSFNELRQRRRKEKDLSQSVAFSSLLREDADGEKAADEYDIAVSQASIPLVDLSSARRLYNVPAPKPPPPPPPPPPSVQKDTTRRPTTLKMGSVRSQAGSMRRSPSTRTLPTSMPLDDTRARGRTTISVGAAAVIFGFIAFMLYFGCALLGFVLGVVSCLVVKDYVMPTLFAPAKSPKPTPLPDYSSLPPLTIEENGVSQGLEKLKNEKLEMDSGVPEERPALIYQGWMFEHAKDLWDPNGNRQKDLLPVYVRLEGSKLVLTGTKTKIPSRIMWNEPPLDPVFTSRREFNISGCPVYLLPFTLSRKRLWNRKYPIVIELRKTGSPIPGHGCDDEECSDDEARSDFESSREFEESTEMPKGDRLKAGGSAGSKKKRVTGFLKSITGKASASDSALATTASDGTNDDGRNDSGVIAGDPHRKTSLPVSPEEASEQSNVFELVDAGMCVQDHLYLFARADRHKEDWFRRLSAASKGVDLDGAIPSHSSTPLKKWDQESWTNRALAVWIDTLSCYYSPSERLSRKMIDYEDYMRNILQSQVSDDRVILNVGLSKGPRIVRVSVKKVRGYGKRTLYDELFKKKPPSSISTKGDEDLLGGPGPGSVMTDEMDEEDDDDDGSEKEGSSLLSGKKLQSFKRKAIHKLETAKAKTLDVLLGRQQTGIDLEVMDVDVDGEEPGVDVTGVEAAEVGTNHGEGHHPRTSSPIIPDGRKASPVEGSVETPDELASADGVSSGTIFHTLHPTEVASSVRWVNCLLSRLLFDFLCDQDFEEMVRQKISSKLKSIRVPGVSRISCVDLDLGSAAPIIHRSSAPVLDERGFWIDFDLSYGGGFRMSVEAKIDLRTLGNDQPTQNQNQEERLDQNGVERNEDSPGPPGETGSVAANSDDENSPSSDDEDAGGPTTFKKILDRVTTSQYFKQVRELKYVRKGVEALAKTPILLSVEVIQIFGVLTINIPPPPADRIWWGFRKKPHVLISARPKVGQTAVNLAQLVELIEVKLLEQIDKFLVIPNMDDIIVPLMTPVTAQFLRAQSCIQVRQDPSKQQKSSFVSAS